MILVAGGSGRLGRLVVEDLLGRGERVRVLTRSAGRADAVRAAGAEVAVGDVRDPASLLPAVEGAEVVVSAVHGFAGPGRVTPASVDRDGNAHLIAATQRVDAAMVLMSVSGAAPGHTMELFRMKAEAEQVLRTSGLSWTIVRAGAFQELWQELLQKGPGRHPLIFGRGDNLIDFVSVHQVAGVVVEAVLDPSLRGQTIEVAGHNRLTLNQLAAQTCPYAAPRHVPRIVLRALTRAAPKPLRRQASAALTMDTEPMAAGDGPSGDADLRRPSRA